MTQDTPAAICDAIAILVAAGILDYNGHVSLRASGGGFHINTAASNRAAMTPDQLCRVDADGTVVEGGRPPNEVHLHAAILAARPDVSVVVHGHPEWTTLFTITGTPIPTVMPQGCLVSDLPLYPQSHSINSATRGRAVAQLMGEARGTLLTAHGSVFAGADLTEAVALAIYAEQNAKRAYLARALGRAAPIGDDEAAEYRTALNKPGLFRKCWDFHLPGRT